MMNVTGICTNLKDASACFNFGSEFKGRRSVIIVNRS